MIQFYEVIYHVEERGLAFNSFDSGYAIMA